MLAALIGGTPADADQLLAGRVVISAADNDPVARALADDVEILISRTVYAPSVGDPLERQVEVVIGAAHRQSKGKVIFVAVTCDSVRIGRKRVATGPCADVARLLLRIGACYAVGAAISALLDERFSGSEDPLVIPFHELVNDVAILQRPVELGEAFLAGAGAIGNGFLWAAEAADVRGQLVIADDDRVSGGNLNRQLYFDLTDVGEYKAKRLAHRVQPRLPRLRLVPRVTRLQEVPERRDGPWLRRLIVTVDSRRARRALQSEMPREVFDASTTGLAEIVLHYNCQASYLACLSCVYAPNAVESAREQHIAEQLDVSLADVRTERVSDECALRIAQKYPQLDAMAIRGLAYDSLFKELCGAGALPAQAGQSILAPFAFVSCLAGALLLIDVIRRLQDPGETQDNYWRVSPWRAPLAGLRRLRVQEPSCQLCGNEILRTVYRRLWSS